VYGNSRNKQAVGSILWGFRKLRRLGARNKEKENEECRAFP
jgi:hypothetical protein